VGKYEYLTSSGKVLVCLTGRSAKEKTLKYFIV